MNVQKQLDLLIRNGRVITGAGNPWFRCDVGIKDKKIVALGNNIVESQSSRIINADSLFVAPGFIDTHSHYGLKIFEDKKCEPLVRQGITAVLFGQDGFSTAPVGSSGEILKRYLSGLDGEKEEWNWDSVAQYLSKVQSSGSSVNFATLTGHGTLRLCVLGFSSSKPTKDQLDEMCQLLRASMRGGAMGLSSGLVYPPSMYADTEELIELGRVLKQFGGVYFSHVRGEGKNLLFAFEEALRIGRESGTPVQISHHKVIGESNWEKAERSIALLVRARTKEGIDVTTDQYPYTAGSTTLTALMPPWSLEGGTKKMIERLLELETRRRVRQDAENGMPGWEGYVSEPHTVMISYCKKTKNFEGKTLAKISEINHKHPTEQLFDILVENDGIASCILYQQSEENVKLIMKDSFSCFCTDGLATGRPHPRLYGTFPRILGRYVRGENVLGLEEAIRKMTSLPAQRLGLRDRGLIQVGMHADIVIFNGETVIDRASFEDPFQFPSGIEYVVVNGTVVVEKGEHTGELPGVAIKLMDHEPS